MQKLIKIKELFDSLRDEPDGFRYKIFRHGYYMGEYKSLIYSLLIGERWGGEFNNIRVFHNNPNVGNETFGYYTEFCYSENLNTSESELFNSYCDIEVVEKCLNRVKELRNQVYHTLNLTS